jgi:hypothetical protein
LKDFNIQRIFYATLFSALFFEQGTVEERGATFDYWFFDNIATSQRQPPQPNPPQQQLNRPTTRNNAKPNRDIVETFANNLLNDDARGTSIIESTIEKD